MGRRTKKSWELYRRCRVGDLGYLLRCVRAGRLADADDYRRRYLETILAMTNLPTPGEISQQLRLINVERERFRAWTIPPVDMTAEQIAKDKMRKDRERKMKKRNRQTREEYLASVRVGEPWVAAGVAKSTWYQHKAKGKEPRARWMDLPDLRTPQTGVCAPQTGAPQTGVSRPQASVSAPSSLRTDLPVYEKK